MLTIQCPACSAAYRVEEKSLGRASQCKRCGRQFRLEVSAPVAVTPEAADDTASRAAGGSLTDAGAPQKVGRFLLRAQLGAGAFGTVYRAFDPILNREVALKLPKAEAIARDDERARFLREPQAAAQLRHPHIVPVYDAGEEGGQLFIASAFIDGETLEKRLERERPTVRHAAELVISLASALEYAHGFGIVHRDVKPANVMIDKQGQPLLADFGLARVQSGQELLTHDGAVMGTPAYMSPEQAAAKNDEVGPASDQYSLGVMLYELLCGERPFSGPPGLVISLVIHQEPPKPRSIDPRIPKDLETVCLKAISKLAADRYASCQDFAADLRRWLDGKPIVARRVPAWERAARWCRRQPVLAGSVASAAVLLLVAILLATMLSKKPKQLLKVVPRTPIPGPEAPDEALTEPPQVALETLPLLEDPNLDDWAKNRGAGGERIQARRNGILSGLSEVDCSKLVDAARPAMGRAQPPNSQGGAVIEANLAGAPLELPQKFILTGELFAIRGVGDSTWVFVRQNGASNFKNAGMTKGVSLILPEFPIAIEFLRNLTAVLSDYRMGDQVRVVVERQKWPVEQQTSHVADETFARALSKCRAEFREFATPIRTVPAYYWCLRGLGLEKAGLTSTWTDPDIGRDLREIDWDEVARSPTFIFRNLGGRAGTTGRLKAAFAGLRGSWGRETRKPTGDYYQERAVVFNVDIDSRSEQPITLEAKMSNTSEDQFADYASGSPVELAVTVSKPGTVFVPLASALKHGALQQPLDPLYGVPVVEAICNQIQLAGRPETRIASWGAPRKPPPPPIESQEPVTCEGYLICIRRRQGEIHLMVDSKEWFTTDAVFLSSLQDYVAINNKQRTDRVVITGHLVGPSIAKFRFHHNKPLYQIRQIVRKDEPGSLAVVGKVRDRSTFRTSTMVSGLAAILRDPPAPGTELRFPAVFGGFEREGKCALRPLPEYFDSFFGRATVVFPALVRDDFIDYDSSHRVNVIADVLRQENDQELRLLGKSIVKLSDPNSLATDHGRPNPPFDFAGFQRRWTTIGGDLAAHEGEKLVFNATFRGRTTTEDPKTRLRPIVIDVGFTSLGTRLEIVYYGGKDADQRIDQLKNGDEFTCECAIGTNNAKPALTLLWMAPLSEPSERFTFSTP